MNLFKGKLTYTMAFVAIVVGAIGWYMGIIEQEQAAQFIWAGITAFGIRRAIS